ncbi:MAG: hypothetical protein ABIT09_03465 [Croceibacterium sp.]
MFGKFPPARRAPGRAFILSVAMLAATVATGSVAQAQDQPRGQKPAKSGNSPGFAKLYAPLAAIVNAPNGDFASAKAQLPVLLAAMQNADDRNLAGNLVLVLGNKSSDRALQRQGLQMMIESGKTDPAKLPQLQYLMGGLAFDAKDYATARTAFEAARTAGFKDENLSPLLAETYFNSNQKELGLATLKSEIQARNAAGVAVPDGWLRRGLQVAYEGKQVAQANEWSTLLVSTHPTKANWTTALQVVNAVNAFDPQVQLDLLRLMATTNSMSERSDYVRYIEAADPRVMSNEVSRVLQAAVTAGALKTGDAYYGEVKRMVDQRSAGDRTDAPRLVVEATKSANGNAALNAGDVLYSLSQYAEAERMYQLALTKGGIDKDKALTRLGIAQAQQGKTAAAKAAFAQVGGARAPVAQMWQAYLASKA